ncbi:MULTISPECIES: I78 family peptidase inhibitor [Streptomyces]|uniref:I78 family peptidase inhibitor n=1 Tax=Streptomyces silvisoli TaxID=3034235 RepID=A0ABT5ZKT0_9ACTN|nr:MULTISPECIES: I78 family peptidase inhibitor [Streptomyces]MDF3290433.1 I78 family peptidase inhibitor [Streptomyces silvisoli]
MAPSPTPGPVPEDDLGQYVGMPAQEAERTAARHGWTTVRALPPDAVITLEYLAGRLNLTVQDGVVTRCWAG